MGIGQEELSMGQQNNQLKRVVEIALSWEINFELFVYQNPKKFVSVLAKPLFCKSMRKLLAAVLFGLPMALSAQQNSIVQEGEFGFGVGGAHYFGDLNTKAKLNRPKFAAGVFFRKNFGNYIAARLAGNFAQLGYSDTYNTHNEFMHRRNLSFNSKVWELAVTSLLPFDADWSSGFIRAVTQQKRRRRRSIRIGRKYIRTWIRFAYVIQVIGIGETIKHFETDVHSLIDGIF